MLSREVQSSRNEKELTFVLPFQKGDQVEGLIIWANHQRKISLSWPSAEEEPTMSIGEAIFEPVQLEAAPLLAKDNPFCRCAQERDRPIWPELYDCSAEVLSPSEGCLSYSATCDELLACANGTPWLPPTCPEGQVNAGALERCYHSCAPNIRECPTGLTCEPWQGAHVCFPGAAKPGIAK